MPSSQRRPDDLAEGEVEPLHDRRLSTAAGPESHERADPVRHADNHARPDASHKRAVIKALRAILPERCLLHAAEDTGPYECDGLTAYRQTPMCVALPETEQQVRQTLTACRTLDVPVVARGAGTSLSGGAMPHASGVLLGLAKLNRILRVDPLARLAVVQPGVRNVTVSEAAAPYDLFFAPDPASQLAATIGGNLAENAGGVHCLKYGLTVHNVLAVRAITIDGEVVELGSSALDAPGYDLAALMSGSEGMLAIATEITLRLLPRPALARVILASFGDVEAAGNAIAAVIAAGIVPAALEMMDQRTTQAVEAFVHAGYDLDAKAIVLCESDGTPEEVDEEISRMTGVLTAAGATGIRVSRTEPERLKLWAGRKAALGTVGRLSPDYYVLDGSVPRRRIAEALHFVAELENKYGLRCLNVFHAGDGNLHPIILFNANDPGEVRRTEAFADEVLLKCVELGGTVTGEHGVGVEKLGAMCSQFSDAELGAFFAVKRAFDPPGLLNPGKAIPTIARCAEFGRMHVRRGQLAFPGLPRF
jgi:glycolate oxidase